MTLNNEHLPTVSDLHSHHGQCGALLEIAVSAEERGDLIGAELCYKQLVERHQTDELKCFTHLITAFTNLLELLDGQGRKDEVASLLDEHHGLVKSVATALLVNYRRASS